MRQVNLSFIFWLCLSLVLFIPVFAPYARLTFFAPFLIISYYQRDFNRSMWLAFGCGVIMDLLTPLPRFGLYALNYSATTLLLYSKKHHFFEDSMSTLPFMVYFFSLFSTIIQVILLLIFGEGLPLSLSWVLTDIGFYPLIDAVYAVPFVLLLRKHARAAAA